MGQTNEVAPVTAFRDHDLLNLLEGVPSLNFHPHLPHYELTTEDEFNSLVWMPPNEERAGDILLADSTIFTVLFGESDSLRNFWRNLATMH